MADTGPSLLLNDLLGKTLRREEIHHVSQTEKIK
jgi:hypothetical protein